MTYFLRIFLAPHTCTWLYALQLITRHNDSQLSKRLIIASTFYGIPLKISGRARRGAPPFHRAAIIKGGFSVLSCLLGALEFPCTFA